MSREGEIRGSLERLIQNEANRIRMEAPSITARFSYSNALRSSSFVNAIRAMCDEGYRDMCTAAARRIADLEGQKAPRLADLLASVLIDAQSLVLEIFDVQTKAAGPSLANAVGRSRQILCDKLDAAADDGVANLRLGIAGGEKVKSDRPSILSSIGDGNKIVALDGDGNQVAIDSPGAALAFKGAVVVTDGIDLDAIAKALQTLRSAAFDLDQANRDQIEDAIINVEREIEQPAPDRSRVKRLAAHLVTLARDLGVGAAGSALASLLF